MLIAMSDTHQHFKNEHGIDESDDNGIWPIVAQTNSDEETTE
jgi:hypothetical protein